MAMPGCRSFQRQVMPEATLVLDWWHISMRFEHALCKQPAAWAPIRRLATFGAVGSRDLEGAKWLLWHGRSSSCLERLTKLAGWFSAPHVLSPHGALQERKVHP